MKNKKAILFLSIFVVLFLFALSYRLYDAAQYGNIWLAFQQDSFFGWPYTHIAGMICMPFLFVGMYYLPFMKSEKKS